MVNLEEKKKGLQLLISTMNQKEDDYSLLSQMNVTSNAVVINQCDRESDSIITWNENNVRWIDTKERGLSKSRNMALRCATEDLCVLADDDEIFNENYMSDIICAFQENEEADIIRFQVRGIEEDFKAYSNIHSRVGYLTSMKIASVEIAFKRKSVMNSSIMFDELIGAGTEFLMGEENSFLWRCLKKNLKIIYVPVSIASLHMGNSTWFQGYNKKYFVGKGAAYTSMSRTFSWPLIIQFAIRHKTLFSNDCTFIAAIQSMLEGRRQYLVEKKKQINFFLLGDFQSDNGPGTANKALRDAMALHMHISYSKEKGKIRRLIESVIGVKRTDVLLICSSSKINYISMAIAKMFKKKILYIMHGFASYEYMINGGKDEEEYLEIVKYEEYVYRNVNAIICVSKHFMEDLKHRKPEWKDKLFYIHNIVDRQRVEWMLQGEGYLQEEESDIYILSTGGGMKQKNNLVIADAIAQINSEGNLKLKYVVVGSRLQDGDEIKKYEFVSYYEQLSHEQLLRLMKGAAVYVQNSTYETFGLSVIEALLAGCALLISQHIGCRDLFGGIEIEDTIFQTEDKNEIAIKIKNLVWNNNNERLRKNFDYSAIQGETVVNTIYALAEN